MVFQPGAVLVGKYRIERSLGAGGMGEVFVATQEPLNRKVAIKVLKSSGVEQGAQAEARFFREMQALARLSHPNVVTVYDSGRAEDGSLYLAMELVDGPTLRDELVARGRLSTAQVVELGGQIARGLAGAHAQKIAHHDLKPENIVLQTSTRGPVVKILDFGIARIFEGEAAPSKVTEEDSAIGTLGYMSPEQLRGTRDDPRSDLYALGCVLFELLAGKPPFSARTGPELALFHLTEKPPRIREITPQADVPPGLEALVRALLEKDPAQRPASADAVVDALARITSATTAATEGSTRAAFVAPPRRTPSRVGVAALVGVVVAAGAAFVVPRLLSRGAQRIAVLEIKTATDDAELEGALVEELALALGNDPALQVVSPFVVEKTQNRFKDDPIGLARELDLDLAIIGRFKQGADKVTLSLDVMEPPAFTDVGGAVLDAATPDALLKELPTNKIALRGVPARRQAAREASGSALGGAVASAIEESRQRPPKEGLEQSKKAQEGSSPERTKNEEAGRPQEPGGAHAGPGAEAAKKTRVDAMPSDKDAESREESDVAPGALLKARGELRKARHAFAQGALDVARQHATEAGAVPAAQVWLALIQIAEGGKPTAPSSTGVFGRERKLVEAVAALDLKAAAVLRAELPDDPVAAWLCAVIAKRDGNGEQASRDEARARALAPGLPPVR